MWHDYQFSSLHQSRMEGNVALDCRTNTHHMYRPWAQPRGAFINQKEINPIMPGQGDLKGPPSVQHFFMGTEYSQTLGFKGSRILIFMGSC